eukprot:UN2494
MMMCSDVIIEHPVQHRLDHANFVSAKSSELLSLQRAVRQHVTVQRRCMPHTAGRSRCCAVAAVSRAIAGCICCFLDMIIGTIHRQCAKVDGPLAQQGTRHVMSHRWPQHIRLLHASFETCATPCIRRPASEGVLIR